MYKRMTKQDEHWMNSKRRQRKKHRRLGKIMLDSIWAWEKFCAFLCEKFGQLINDGIEWEGYLFHFYCCNYSDKGIYLYWAYCIVWRKIMDYITTVEMSKIWGISSRRISLLCSQGRVPGAEKKGKTWLLPKDAVKPTDPRKKNQMTYWR